MATACLEGFRELGLPVLDDLNGEREITGEGFAYMNQIIKHGRRHSMARAFLYPVLAQENVTVLVNTQVNRVILEHGRAVGVECVRNGKTQTFRTHREIILSTGGFNTPKLLMLSGIGPKAELRAFNIPVHVDSPNVGENVQDHVLHGGCLYEAPEPFVYTNSAANVSGYYKTDPSFELPDVSIVEIELPYASPVIAEEFPPPPNTWALCGGLVTPQSRGTVKLRSANPADRPIVDMRFLSHPDDVVKLERSIKIAREAAATAALKPFVVREVAPGRTLKGKELVNFVRNGTTTYFHSSGACRMGKDEAAVVDPQLRVNGVRTSHCRQHRHAPHRGRADYAGLRLHRSASGRTALSGRVHGMTGGAVRQHYVTSADGTKISASITGTGPPLVVSPGSLGAAEDWQFVADALAPQLTSYAVDRRGHGASQDSPSFSLEREQEDIAAVLDLAGPDATLLGHSYGAVIALGLALRQPPARLVLYDLRCRWTARSAERPLRITRMRFAMVSTTGRLRWGCANSSGCPMTPSPPCASSRSGPAWPR